MSAYKPFTRLFPLAIILLGLVGYNLINAQWTGPIGTPPADNVDAPINISGNYQAKLGDLGAVRMRAGEYCDAAGLNCWNSASSSQNSALGVNQIWTNPPRTGGVVYQNTTGRPIYVSVSYPNNNPRFEVSTNTTNWIVVGPRGYYGDSSIVVPDNYYYMLRFSTLNYPHVNYHWAELR